MKLRAIGIVLLLCSLLWGIGWFALTLEEVLSQRRAYWIALDAVQENLAITTQERHAAEALRAKVLTLLTETDTAITQWQEAYLTCAQEYRASHGCLP